MRVSQECLRIIAQAGQRLQKSVQVTNLKRRPGRRGREIGHDAVVPFELDTDAFRANAIYKSNEIALRFGNAKTIHDPAATMVL
jgi:hypothetical protein